MIINEYYYIQKNENNAKILITEFNKNLSAL